MPLKMVVPEINHERACGWLGGKGSFVPTARPNSHFVNPAMVPVMVVPGSRMRRPGRVEVVVDFVGRRMRVRVRSVMGLRCIWLRLWLGRLLCWGSLGLAWRLFPRCDSRAA